MEVSIDVDHGCELNHEQQCSSSDNPSDNQHSGFDSVEICTNLSISAEDQISLQLH